MKHRIIKIAAILAILVEMSSCATHYHTDNKRPAHYHYRKGGRAW